MRLQRAHTQHKTQNIHTHTQLHAIFYRRLYLWHKFQILPDKQDQWIKKTTHREQEKKSERELEGKKASGNAKQKCKTIWTGGLMGEKLWIVFVFIGQMAST